MGEGTGLGLALVHGIVTNDDGRIEVSSALGSGTRFEIFLPTAQAEIATRREHASRRLERTATAETIYGETGIIQP